MKECEDDFNHNNIELPEQKDNFQDLDWQAIMNAQIERDERYKKESLGHCQVFAGHF